MTRRFPYRRVLDEVVREVFDGGTVVRVGRLGGGLASLMHAVDVDVDGVLLRLTLRRFHRPELGHDADLARREWHVLTHLHRAGLAVPEPLWLDADGGRFGLPAMLLRRLPGAPVLDPTDLRGWARGLAQALARIHSVAVGPLAGGLPAETREQRNLRWLLADATDTDLLSPIVDARAMIAGVRERVTGAAATLSHGDYHAGNVLWSRGRLAGVIDWSTARLGDPRFDVAYLRLDTALLLGDGGAEAVATAYTDATAGDLDDLPVWDIFAATMALPDPITWLPGYVELGRADLDATIVQDRFRRFVERAIAEL